MRIALDFDGVMAQTMHLWCKRNNELGYTHRTIADIKQWSFFKDFNMSVDQAFDIFHWCWRNWQKLPPLELDQWHKTRRLAEFGEIDIVTSIEPKFNGYLLKWLDRYDIFYNNIVHKLDKQDLEYDIYIDDSPMNAIKMSQAGKICLLYNQPWNCGLRGKNIIRVYNLDHAYDVIKNKLLIPSEFDLNEAR